MNGSDISSEESLIIAMPEIQSMPIINDSVVLPNSSM
jgi:hypothetical protein